MIHKNTIEDKTRYNLTKSKKLLPQIDSFLNCINCDVCKLWGKIQFKGLEVAISLHLGDLKEKTLEGNDLIFLLHLLYKLASSITFINNLESNKSQKLSYLMFYWVEILVFAISLSFLYFLNYRINKKI